MDPMAVDPPAADPAADAKRGADSEDMPMPAPGPVPNVAAPAPAVRIPAAAAGAPPGLLSPASEAHASEDAVMALLSMSNGRASPGPQATQPLPAVFVSPSTPVTGPAQAADGADPPHPTRKRRSEDLAEAAAASAAGGAHSPDRRPSPEPADPAQRPRSPFQHRAHSPQHHARQLSPALAAQMGHAMQGAYLVDSATGLPVHYAFSGAPGIAYAHPHAYPYGYPAQAAGQAPHSPGSLVAVVVPTNPAWAAGALGGPGGVVFQHFAPAHQQGGKRGSLPPGGYAAYPPVFPVSTSLAPAGSTEWPAGFQQAGQARLHPSGLVLPPPSMVVDEASSPETNATNRTSPSDASPVSSTLYPGDGKKSASDAEDAGAKRRRGHRRNLTATSTGSAGSAHSGAASAASSREARVFQCEQCGKVLKSSGHYHRHRREVHERKRDYVCTVCNEAFSRQEHLSRHMASHERGTAHPAVRMAGGSGSPGLSSSSYEHGSSPRSILSDLGPSPVLAAAGHHGEAGDDGRSAFQKPEGVPVQPHGVQGDGKAGEDLVVPSPISAAANPGEHFWRDERTQ
ncbi:hypothetical protein DFJ74DRAFT_714680 [Hyaloraphidium curvatum]|nr:hypothetical protein DFJ74DRAFT_714680 [Hyaloraphidium curvatum]